MRWRTGFLAGVLLGAAALVAPAVAPAATPTIAESFSPAEIPVGGASTVTFTISSSDPTATGVSFTDALPSGLSVPSTPSTNCPGTATAPDSSHIDFSAPLGVGAGSCTVTAQVTGDAPNHYDNPVTLSSSQGTAGTGDVFLDVAAPPTISAAFGTSTLGLDGTTSLTFTIANPNPDLTLTAVDFSDTLPSGLVFTLPAGGSTCPAGMTGTVAPGSTSISFTGAELPPAASCTVSETVAATGVGTMTDTTTPVVSNEGRAGNAASATITVIGAPVVSLSSPAGGRVYAFGQRVRASFGCADDPNGPGISSCTGTVPSGALIDTAKAGSHLFTVTATSLDGGTASDTVFYTVAPDNRFTLGHVHVRHDGSIDFGVKLPGPGRLDVLETVRGTHLVFARAHDTATRAGRVHLTIGPNANGRRAWNTSRQVQVLVRLTYTPRAGSPRTAHFRFGFAT